MYVWTPSVQSCVPLVAIGLLAACAAPPTVSMDVPPNPVFEPTSLGTSTPVPSVPLSTPTPSYVVVTSPDQVLGTWHLHAEGLRFYSDGTFRMARSVGGLESNPFAIGSYAFDGDRVLLTDIQVFGVPSCGSTIGKYELRLLEDGRLAVVVMGDDCHPRADDIRGIYEPVK